MAYEKENSTMGVTSNPEGILITNNGEAKGPLYPLLGQA